MLPPWAALWPWAGALAAGGRQLTDVGPEALVSLHKTFNVLQTFRNHYLPNFVKILQGSARVGKTQPANSGAAPIQ